MYPALAFIMRVRYHLLVCFALLSAIRLASDGILCYSDLGKWAGPVGELGFGGNLWSFSDWIGFGWDILMTGVSVSFSWGNITSTDRCVFRFFT